MNKPHKIRASFWQKIIVIICGVLFSAVILELGVRAGGFIFSSLQESRNKASIRKNGSYKIMCLGESTTVGAYPHFLEETLNKNDIGIKFSVVNKGVAGTNSAGILLALENNLNKYQPDMIVAMMGYNDRFLLYWQDIPEANTILFEYCRAYRLLRLMYMLMANRLRKDKIHSPDKIGIVDKDRIIRIKWLFKKTIELNPKNDWAYFVLGCLYKREGRLDEARKALKKAIDLNPRDAMVYDSLYRMDGKLLWPEGLLQKAIELDPENDGVYVALGLNYQEQGRLSEAKDSYNKAIKLNPENDMAYFGSAFVCRREGRFFDAEALVKKAIELNPKNDWAYIILGEVYDWTNRGDKTEELFRKAVELNPREDVWAYINLGYLLFWNGRFLEAEKVFKKAIELRPEKDRAYINLGSLLFKGGRFSEAEKVFKKAIELNPDNDTSYRFLASLYRHNDRKELAEEYCRKASKTRSAEYCPMAVSNYQKLKEILDKRGIKLVCVQYPMRNIGPLKKIFAAYDGVVFVDNEKVFKKAVVRGGYEEYFVDMFAGDFGHCTNKGNRLLAENIANVILKEYFKK
jgi:Flp pilus assembly protein TadD